MDFYTVNNKLEVISVISTCPISEIWIYCEIKDVESEWNDSG